MPPLLGDTTREKCYCAGAFGRDSFRPLLGSGSVGGRFSHGWRRGLRSFRPLRGLEPKRQQAAALQSCASM